MWQTIENVFLGLFQVVQSYFQFESNMISAAMGSGNEYVQLLGLVVYAVSHGLVIFAVGQVFKIFASGNAQALVKLAEGGSNLLTSAGRAGENVSVVPKILAESVKEVGTGARRLLETPALVVEKAADVRLAAIEAQAKIEHEDATVTLRPDEVEVRLTGRGANDKAQRVLDSAGRSVDRLQTRVLTDNDVVDVQPRSTRRLRLPFGGN